MALIFVSILEFLFMTLLHSAGILVDNVSVSAALVLFTAIDCIAINQDYKLNNCKNQIICGLLLRVLLLYFDQYGKTIFQLPNSGADSEGFYRTCLRIIASGTPRGISDFPGLMSKLMFYVGTNRLNAQFIVVIFSLLSLVFIGYTLETLDVGADIERRIMWIVCLLPNFAILGSIFLRESLVTMLVSASVYSFARWIRHGGIMRVVLSMILILFGIQYHSGIIGIAVGYFVALVLYNHRDKSIRISFWGMMLTGIFIVAFTYFYNNFGEQFFYKMANIESVNDIANTSTEGGSSYATYVGNSNSIVSIIIYTPLRLIYFLFSPFPWQWRGIADIVAFAFSSMFYLYTIGKAIKTYRHSEGDQRIQLLLWIIIALSVTFVFAWGVSNTGTATRHRDKLVPVFTIILSISMMGTKDNQNNTTSKYIIR